LHILAAVAQSECELIRERVTAAMKNARQKGKRLEWPERVFDRQRGRRIVPAGSELPSDRAGARSWAGDCGKGNPSE